MTDRELLTRVARSAGGKAGYKQLVRELSLGGGRERRLLLEQLARLTVRGALVKLDRGGPVAASDGAAPDSVEGQLRAQGKGWVPSEGEITLGAYVKDMLVGRANQPAGRGDIGRVVALALGANGRPHVRVDFGRGYSVGIPLSQLSLVEVVLLQGGGF